MRRSRTSKRAAARGVALLILSVFIWFGDSGWELSPSAMVCLDAEGSACDVGNRKAGARDILVLISGLDASDSKLSDLAFDWSARLPSSWQPFRLVQVAVFEAHDPDEAAVRRVLSRARRRVAGFEPELVILSPEFIQGERADPWVPSASPARWGTRKFGWLVWPWQRDEQGKPLSVGVDDDSEFMRRLRVASGERLPEKILPGLEGLSLGLIDRLSSSLLQFSSSIWEESLRSEVKLSEVLAANGASNLDVTRYPERVRVERSEPWVESGGLGVGRGVWRVGELRSPSSSDAENVRIRAVGPVEPWHESAGKTSAVLLFDADKNHPEHPTSGYDVEVRWLRKSWKVCVAGLSPYPCSDTQRMTFRKRFKPTRQVASIPVEALAEAPVIVRRWFCAIGMEPACRLAGVRTPASVFAVDRIQLQLPYERIELPATEWFSTYEWRFQSVNEFGESGFTDWVKLERLR